MIIDRIQLESDYASLLKTIKSNPDKFPEEPFGISRIQRALKIGYGRAVDLQNMAIERGVLKRIKNTYKVVLVRNAPNESGENGQD